jgi:hypothetical protein
MKNASITAEAAIDESVMHNATTYCLDTPENRATLLAECDDNVDADESEYWGTTDTGATWRVHLSAA